MRTMLLVLVVFLSSCSNLERVDAASEDTILAQVITPAEQNSTIEQANHYISNHHYTPADQLLTTIDSSMLNQALSDQYTLAQAQISLGNNNSKQALIWLNKIKGDDFDAQQHIQYHASLIAAYYRDDKPLHSAMIRMSGEDSPANNAIIWQDLHFTTPHFLRGAINNSSDVNTTAWLQLALYSMIDANNPPHLTQQLQAWQQHYPEHPANYLLENLNLPTTATKTEHFAVLLPLSGTYADLGQSLQKGIVNAQYTSATKPTLRFYDTAKDDSIKSLYHQAINDGAELIIGPLTKDNAQAMNHINTDVPVITLNYTDGRQSPNDYQLGLSPLDEAKQVAQFAWRKGGYKTIIIAADDERAQKIADAYQQQWLSLGGIIVTSMDYSDTAELNKDLAELLGVNDSNWRHYLLQKTIHSKVQFHAKRRQDFDNVFLVANSANGRRIRPLLKFYYVNNIPIYSTSTIYSGIENAHDDQDLNGVSFCDAPFLINPDNNMKKQQQQFKQLWPDNFQQYARLYALGIDAYNIALNLNRMQSLPQFPWRGYAGNLSLNNQQFYRQLPCGEFIDGIVKNRVL